MKVRNDVGLELRDWEDIFSSVITAQFVTAIVSECSANAADSMCNNEIIGAKW